MKYIKYFEMKFEEDWEDDDPDQTDDGEFKVGDMFYFSGGIYPIKGIIIKISKPNDPKRTDVVYHIMWDNNIEESRYIDRNFKYYFEKGIFKREI